MVHKTDDEIYVSSSIGEYIITFHLFSKKVVLLKISKVK